MSQIECGEMDECTNNSMTNHCGIAVDLIHNNTDQSRMFFSPINPFNWCIFGYILIPTQMHCVQGDDVKYYYVSI